MKDYKNLLNKKVCILTSVHPAMDARIFYKEAHTLARVGYNVILVAVHEKDEIVSGIKIISLPKKRFLKRISGLDKRVYKIALDQKADIYHFGDPELLPWMTRLKKKTKAKVIYDVHEDVPKQILSKYWIPKIFRKQISIFFNFLEKNLSRKFDYIITATDEIKDNFKGINKTESVRNFPILEYFKKYKRNSLNKKNFNLIYIGGLAKIRGISETVKAMEYLPDSVRLKLLGKFSPESYENEIKALNGFKKVEYLGWVNLNKIPFYLSQADVGLICLWPEPNYINSSTPTKLFEYMAAGIPVIASNFPLWRDIIGGNKCGLTVDPTKPKAIAKAAEWLIEHPEEAQKMGENGRKAVLEKYNWEAESKKLLKIYGELFKE